MSGNAPGKQKGTCWRTPLALLVLLAIALTGAWFGNGPRAFAVAAPARQAAHTESFSIPQQRRIHILVGDATGGGHKHGMGYPGKTEFPQGWDDEKIIAAAFAVANDSTIPMRASGKYWLKMKEIDGVQVRVVLDRALREVVTAYPLNLPRNPGRKARSAPQAPRSPPEDGE